MNNYITIELFFSGKYKGMLIFGHGFYKDLYRKCLIPGYNNLFLQAQVYRGSDIQFNEYLTLY